MIKGLNSKNRKNDIKLLSLLIAVFLFVVWLCTPPGNKFAQLCFYGNNTRFFIAKITGDDKIDEWKFHRNNAVYLARMEYKKQCFQEIDKAIMTIPNYASDKELNELYKDRAELRLYFGDFKGALDDYSRIADQLDIRDRFVLALLHKENGNNKYALTYCNSILNTDPNAYAGYACIADVYASAGRYKTAVRVFDLLIDKFPNKAKYYADRAMYKLKVGDTQGSENDMKKARELLYNVDVKSSIIYEALHPQRITLEII